MILKWIAIAFAAVNFTPTAKGLCEMIMVQKAGTFSSPNSTQIQQLSNGSIYKCKWTIALSTGIIKLSFKHFAVGIEQALEKCDPNMSVTVTEMSNKLLGQPKETILCGAKPPPVYYSKGSTLSVTLTGYVSGTTNEIASFEAWYESINVIPTTLKLCGPCGGNFDQSSGVIRSPNYPGLYPNNCDCKWRITVRRNYQVQIKFWSFSLEKSKNHICHDYLMIFDGSSASSKSLGKFCGDKSPGQMKTTSNSAFVHFHSDFSNSGKGFEFMFQSMKDESDLSSLRSIAAILGGVSFGIFVFLLLCSVIYKKYINNDNNRNTCTNQDNPESDYLDAVQAAAPPSYQAVMADPEHYPRTPEVTPSGSPDVTPSLLRRNIIRPTPYLHDGSQHLESLQEDDDAENPPPPYPGNMEKETQDEDLLIKDLPPPPTYEMVSDSEDHSDSPATWDPVGPRLEPRLIRSEASDSYSHTVHNDSCDNTPPEDRLTLTIDSSTTSRTDADCDHVPSNTRTRKLRRRSSDSSIHERLVLLNNNSSNHRQRNSLRRRNYSSGHRRTELLNNRQSAHADDRIFQSLVDDATRMTQQAAPNERASSAPLFSERRGRSCPSDLPDCNDTNQSSSSSNSPIVLVRSLLSRHSHLLNTNRVVPDPQSDNTPTDGTNTSHTTWENT